MHILFIHSVECGPSLRAPLIGLAAMQFGISYISAVLKKANHTTALVVLSSEREEASMHMAEEAIELGQPEVIAFTCVSSQFQFISRIAESIRQRFPNIYQVIGGPHVSLNPDQALALSFDAVCIGEGEHPMYELVTQLQNQQEPDGIANFWLKRSDGFVQKNHTRRFLEDLDSLPFPDRMMWLPWVDAGDFYAPSILMGRGCPYLCAYCCNHALRKLSEGKYVRLRKPKHIIEEVDWVYKHLLENELSIYLEIETIGIKKEWILELCDSLQCYNATLPRPIRFQTNFRVTAKSLDPDIFRALKTANILRLNIGLEAGSERVRRDILKRNYTNAEFDRAIHLAREHGLEFNLFNMIGIPGETLDDHFETIRLNRDAAPNLSYTSIFYPYPGTELYKKCEERGLISNSRETRQERKCATLDTPEFPRASVQKAYDLFDYRIHKGHWPWHIRARKLLRHYLSKSRFTEDLFLAAIPFWRFLARAGLVTRNFGKKS